MLWLKTFKTDVLLQSPKTGQSETAIFFFDLPLFGGLVVFPRTWLHCWKASFQPFRFRDSEIVLLCSFGRNIFDIRLLWPNIFVCWFWMVWMFFQDADSSCFFLQFCSSCAHFAERASCLVPPLCFCVGASMLIVLLPLVKHPQTFPDIWLMGDLKNPWEHGTITSWVKQAPQTK